MNGGLDSDADRDNVNTSPSSSKSAPSHRRTLSGNLFSRLNFLRSTSSEDRINQVSSTAIEHDPSTDNGVEPSTRSAMAAVQGSLNGRKRKTSLRKTALLGGTGRRKSLPLQRRASTKQQVQIVSRPDDTSHGRDDQETPRLRQSFSYESLDAASSSDSAWSSKPTDLTVDTRQHTVGRHESATLPSHQPTATAPIASTSPSVASPASQSYASTTDDDDVLSFSRRPVTGPLPPASTSISYYASQAPLTRRRSNKQAAAANLDSIPLESYISSIPIEEELDYSDTEWWGWVVLIVTWFAFVVGMGSCFGVWSWAWDVGQTPYAPPELEDDPTLPIVGYYPALITLTAVMAWVWVIIAWVGIKYFKHAKIQGDDT